MALVILKATEVISYSTYSVDMETRCLVQLRLYSMYVPFTCATGLHYMWQCRAAVYGGENLIA